MGQENGGERGGGGERKCGDGSRRRVGREVESLRIGGRRYGRQQRLLCLSLRPVSVSFVVGVGCESRF